MSTAQIYDFPVQKERLFTKDGVEAINSRALVRTDTNKFISTVSDKYNVIEHKLMVDRVLECVKHFGDPVAKFDIAQEGRKLICQFDLIDKTVALKKGDKVGLRVFARGTYDAKQSMLINIGGVRLICTNGMVAHNSDLSIKVNHIGDTEWNMPHPDQLWDIFAKSGKNWEHLQTLDMTETEYAAISAKAVELGIVPEKALQSPTDGQTAWDMYNQFTHFVSHTSKSQAFGRFNRLNKIDGFFQEVFNASPVAV